MSIINADIYIPDDAMKSGVSFDGIVVGTHDDSGNEGDGADDNASGVAVMLEMAEKISDVDTPYMILIYCL